MKCRFKDSAVIRAFTWSRRSLLVICCTTSVASAGCQYQFQQTPISTPNTSVGHSAHPYVRVEALGPESQRILLTPNGVSFEVPPQWNIAGSDFTPYERTRVGVWKNVMPAMGNVEFVHKNGDRLVVDYVQYHPELSDPQHHFRRLRRYQKKHPSARLKERDGLRILEVDGDQISPDRDSYSGVRHLVFEKGLVEGEITILARGENEDAVRARLADYGNVFRQISDTLRIEEPASSIPD